MIRHASGDWNPADYDMARYERDRQQQDRAMALDELRSDATKRQDLLERARDLTTRGDLVGDDLARFERLEAEVERIDKRRELLEALASGRASPENAIKPPDEYLLRPRAGETVTTDTLRTTTDVRSLALRSIDADDFASDAAKQAGHAIIGEHGDPAAHYLAAVSAPAYARAFAKVVADPETGRQRLTGEEAEAMAHVRAIQQVGTGNLGGFAVPFALDPSLVLTSTNSANPIPAIARNETIVNATTWKGVSTAGSTFSWDAELDEVSEDSFTLGQPTVNTHKLQGFVPYSIELEGDWPGFANEMQRVIADGVAALESTAWVNGTGDGNDQPTGIVTALDGGASEVAPTTGETFALADTYKLAEALPERHWTGASWLLNRGTAFEIRQEASALESGSSVWTDIGQGIPPMLLGQPVYTTSEMDSSAAIDTGATADNFVLLVGDFSNFIIVTRLGLTVEVVPHVFGDNGRPKGQRGLYVYARKGAGVLNADAFRLLNVATTE